VWGSPPRSVTTMVAVSAIIPVYNQDRYLAAAIHSVLAQTCRDFEVIVVDDGSTDRTPEVIASYGDRIRAYRKANGGVATALNHGIRQARGDAVGWLSSDDLWEPSKLERQLEVLASRPEVGLVYTDVWVIDAADRVLRRTSSPVQETGRRFVRSLLRHCFVNGTSVLVRRSVFDAVGLFDERIQIATDYDMWLRIAQAGYEFVHIPEPLARYRVHPAQDSFTKSRVVTRSGRRVAARALHRMGSVQGAAGAVLRLKDDFVAFPWWIRPSGGGYSLSGGLGGVLDAVKVLVNPEAP
jgi:glycosyltransferase involved in cell wall biosynthesis